ncbi:class I SAM-dependent methyltransferase [Anaerobacillus alkaliphilus]|uniref:Uncharacterized methyltransferase DS745_22100 n=1 Tax=Anaerobacillus alkaliphilus TaxID=1548597 RepID=A0A4Q0VNI3_9BACI|nr:class I SAM-dependent methyltransferase [Anaerobacillus alkaliphilus]RXI96410.1 class I SAM-dependent methyltransferase [Anaerobacillus alkaliphilus]
MGREFVELFDNWAESYDHSVSGKDLEYEEVFSNYDEILQAVTDRVKGNIVEFGVGTGNLTIKLLENGHRVVGFEPSTTMREKAEEKLSNATIVNGDFLEFQTDMSIDAFVSTYAFHHLTDAEKAEAVSKYSSLLAKNGKVVFADTVFESEATKADVIQSSKKKGFLNLAQDLETEYYTTIPVLRSIFEANGFSVQFEQLNPFVWMIDATKL